MAIKKPVSKTPVKKSTAAAKPAAKSTKASAPAKTSKTKAAAPAKKAVTKKAAAPAAKSSKTTSKTAAPAKKVVAKRGAVVKVAIKPCKRKFTASEFLNMAAERTGLERKQVKSVLDLCQEFIIANLMNGGVGQVKLLGWNFKSIKKPAQKGGVKKPNPFKPGEMMVTKAKPASMRAKALALKVVKDCISL